MQRRGRKPSTGTSAKPQKKRLSKEELLKKLAPLDGDGLRTLLWKLYLRGGAALQERIQAELEPEKARKAKQALQEADAELLDFEVERFVELARTGQYIGGSRAVSPKERSRWRVTFRSLLDTATDLVERGDLERGAPALEALLDLANDTQERNYFRSDDPVNAMKVVFSDRVALLWRALLRHEGYPSFATRAAAQIVRWESSFGWTRGGFTSMAGKEQSLASIASEIVHGHDSWVVFTDAYLAALDALVRKPSTVTKPSRTTRWAERENARRGRYECERRTRNLAELHAMLLDVLAGTDAEDRLQRITRHPALAGPDRTFLAARLAQRRNDLETARKLVTECVNELPGRRQFQDLANELGVKVPQPNERQQPSIVFIGKLRG